MKKTHPKAALHIDLISQFVIHIICTELCLNFCWLIRTTACKACNETFCSENLASAFVINCAS